jgi:hypothetical protein
MNQDFHYYGTYCAAILAGYTAEESLSIAYCANFVDFCTRSLLVRIKGPLAAATSMQQLEMMDSGVDLISLQNITRIWSSFHFLPGDLHATRRGCGRRYLNKYRLICNPNGELAAATVKLAKDKGLEAAGIAMHVLADTWAHRYFAGTPSLVINNTNEYFYELLPGENGFTRRQIRFMHNPAAEDDPETGRYNCSVYQPNENSVMNLGHARAGHLPDYSWIRYIYLPAWGEFRELLKDNPSEYMHAFRQMVYALRFLRGDYEDFQTARYDTEKVDPLAEEITRILETRQLNASADWKALGEKLSGVPIPDFDIETHQAEYVQADAIAREDTLLGRFLKAALAQKSMVTGLIFQSGNRLAGFSVDYRKKGFRGIRDFRRLIDEKAVKRQ